LITFAIETGGINILVSFQEIFAGTGAIAGAGAGAGAIAGAGAGAGDFL